MIYYVQYIWARNLNERDRLCIDFQLVLVIGQNDTIKFGPNVN